MEIFDNYQPAVDLLKDRVVLVTGAGDGIGGAAARAFAAHGATLILLGRTVRKLESTYDAIEQAGGPQPAIYPMNLESATLSDCENMATTIEAEFGRLDGLLHNAALLGTLTPVEHYDIELWTRVMQVNLNAPFLLTRACLPLLRESEDASIVFTSSAPGRNPHAYWGAYAVSNAGIESLAAVLADELEA
ncbi:MAG: SDR family NAD(P)-dependent oxidoreductase, partial [Pseudomonadota bacterium]